MDKPISLTIPDVVRASGLSRTSIYEALRRGDLKAHKAGRRTLVTYLELEEYLKNLPAYEARV